MERIEFVRSQVEYYRKHLRSGASHDRHLIDGLYLRYSQELRELEKALTLTENKI